MATFLDHRNFEVWDKIGNTPARKVRIQTAADILPIPIPETLQFLLPDGEEVKDAGIVGAHQTYLVAGTVKLSHNNSNPSPPRS